MSNRLELTDDDIDALFQQTITNMKIFRTNQLVEKLRENSKDSFQLMKSLIRLFLEKCLCDLEGQILREEIFKSSTALSGDLRAKVLGNVFLEVISERQSSSPSQKPHFAPDWSSIFEKES